MRGRALFLAALLAAAPALALTGTLQTESGEPLSFGTLILMDQKFTQVLGHGLSDAQGAFTLPDPPSSAFLVVQPAGQDDAEGVHVYAFQPRIYAVEPGAAPLDLRLPAAMNLVIEAYDISGRRLRWEDFQRMGVHGGQFLYGTNLDDQMIPATCWPIHGPRNGTTPADPRETALPGLLVPIGVPASVTVLFWPTAGYGKLMLRADNAGKGFQGEAPGDAQVLLLNLELARTAVAELARRRPLFPEGASEIEALQRALDAAAALEDRPASALAADQVLAEALALRDTLELARARASIPSVRSGTLTLALAGLDEDALAKTTVRIEPVSHDFLFGLYEGTDAGPDALEKLAPLGFNLATVLPAWGWSEDPKAQRKYLDDRFGISRLHKLGMTIKAHGVVWLQEYGILPKKAFEMSPERLSAAVLAQEAALMETFAEEIGVWEIMNEPATTNVVQMPTAAVEQMLAASAAQISKANRPGLVNSPHEFSFGAKYLIHGTNNVPQSDYPRTFSTFLDGLAQAGLMEHVGILGLQCYPGFHLNTNQFGGQQGPAYTPSHLLDMLDRYVRFGKPLHITEFTLPDTYGEDWYAGYWKAPWTPALQTEYAEAVYTLAYAHPQVHSITWWDAVAANPAVIGGSLLDAKGKPKPVLDRIAALLKQWHPQEVIELKGEATLTQNLPGGRYTVTVQAPDSPPRVETIHVLERWTRPLIIDFGGDDTGQS